jgi:predicted transcriptional regulator of viral defense system
VEAAGIHHVHLSELVADGTLTKIKNGLYILPQEETVSGFYEVELALPSAVICLGSALSHYNLATYEPAEVHVAIRRNDRTLPADFPPVRLFSFSGARYDMGIAYEEIEGHTIRIYDREKTICDAIRYRKVIGDDAVYESARTYLARADRSIDRLLDYADRLRMLPTVERIIRAYI